MSKSSNPKWKQCLLANLGRSTLPSRASQVSTRVIEALPKLFGEYFHQSLCKKEEMIMTLKFDVVIISVYSCPLHRLNVPMSSSSSAIAATVAATARVIS